MKLRPVVLGAAIAAVFLTSIPPAWATSVKHVDLPALTTSAARVFRGVVTDVRPGSVKVGGGELPTTIYRIRVVEAFKGEFTTVKDVTFADVEMIGSLKAGKDRGAKHFELVRDMPSLERGKNYLLFLTAESRIALSSPVGLAQGLFEIDTTAANQPTANGLNNAGLVAGVARGPMPYSDLAARVRALIAGKKGDE